MEGSGWATSPALEGPAGWVRVEVKMPSREPMSRDRRGVTGLARLAAWLILLGLVLPVAGAQAGPASGQPVAQSNGGHPGEGHPGPPGGFPFPHPHVHPPKGKVPDPETPVIIDGSALGSPIVLNRNWRLGIAKGDSPAQPDFDDSEWPTRDAREALAEVNEPDEDSDGHPHDRGPGGKADGQQSTDGKGGRQPGGRPFAWFRIHIQVPEHHGPLAVLVRLPVTRNARFTVGPESVGMDLFANGKEMVAEGPNGAAPEGFQKISRLYPLNLPEGESKLTLAVRIPFVPFGMDAYTGFFATRTFILGQKEDLVSHLDLWNHALLFERLPSLVDSGLRALLAVFLLALFWTQRDHAEYLWLGLHLVVLAPLSYMGYVVSTARAEQLSMTGLLFELLLISAYFYLEFLVAFLSLRRRWYIRALRYSAPLLLTFGPLFLAMRHGRPFLIGLAVSAVFCLLWILAWVLFTVITLSVSAIKRNYEAALLLVPLLMDVIGLGESAMPYNNNGMGTQSPLTFYTGPIPIHFDSIADFVGILVIILIIFFRFMRIHRERERASSELAAAKSVQELMIPRDSPKTPGFQVDSIYTPAAEVGGDFFHIESTKDGGLLVVIGDVAGHGLQAAMNVSMLMGALRRSEPESPARLLSGLNEVLVGSASFTTCQVALFTAEGALTIASAGHPPPYLNSQEVLLPGGLPLGVVASLVYEETTLYLHPGDRLLMMSDGVAEARRANGELFGFERVRNLSNQSAFFIAEAAKEFGQEDDITVLTVRRLAQAMAA